MIQPSILIVEDEVVVAEDLAQKVRDLGYCVIGLTSAGEAALELVQEQHPNLVLLDIKLNGKWDGIETANRLREVCDLPFLFITAHSDPETVKRATAAGAFGYVLKPFRERDLEVQIRAALYMSERKKTEQKLKKTEDLLLRAQRGAQAGVWEIDLRTDRITWSAPYYDLFGIDSSIEPSVGAWLYCIHPEDRERVIGAYRQSIKDKSNQNMEFRIVKPDGEIRWIHRQGQVEVDEQGNAIRIQGISFDVTERKHADEVVSAIALFPAQNPSPVLRISGAGILLYMNPVSHQRLRDLNLRLGQPVPLILENLAVNALRATESQQAEYALGSCHYLITVTPVTEGHYANFYWTDVTQRKRAEVEVHESREKLRRALEFDEAVMTNMGEGLYTVNNEGLVTSINPAAEALFGWTCAELLGRKMHDMTHYKHADGTPFPAEQCPGLQVLKEGRELRDQEDVFIRKDGSFFHVIYSSSPIRAGDKIDGLVVVFRDITERKHTEERLKQFTTELEQRVAERTHELVESEGRLRTLATELNLAEQRERKRLASDLHDHLQQLLALGKLKVSQLTHLSETSASANVIAETDKILTEAISYTRTLVAELSPPVLRNHGLSAGLKWLEEFMRRYHLEVKVQIPDEKIPVADDQALLLFQSVRELLINTSKYAETSQAWVRATVDTHHLIIEVMDKGKGFALDSNGSANIPTELSSKFGLFSIRERIHALGGSFQITSALGSGTTAVLKLPMSAADVSSQASSTSDTCSELSLPLFPLTSDDQSST
jgi:PAS domain S-box-containing protein